MGLFDKLRKPKTIKSGAYGEVIMFISEEKLPHDLVELNKMSRYYTKPYNGQKPEYDKAFLITRKLVQLDTEKRFMEARCRLGDLYANGQGTARDVVKGDELRNEWYAHAILHEDSIYSLALQLPSCMERHCMSLQQMTELAYARLKLDWENYAPPVGAAVLELLNPFWKSREVQAANGWTNEQYANYLYDSCQDPNVLYVLSRFEKDYQKANTMVYQAADEGSIFGISVVTNLKLAYEREEAGMKRLLEYRAKEDQLVIKLQEKAGVWVAMELEEIMK